MKESKV